ncbi:hypothetical protein [Stenotrophomonas sp. YIM B06876]|uniref:hypothetical protein n=1 Tax=Stenotrophomonas sp. YIM B06876 TaxID=3060211 RepID=UPI002738CA43|nr:hypothetical protein [Stenotrophomonas sp. YIM B06876]
MNSRSHSDPFEQSLQHLHDRALASVSSSTLAQLRHARHSARAAPAVSPWRQHRWWLATACSAVLAVTAALNFHAFAPHQTAPVRPQAASTAMADDDTLLLDESPELYLWLGSDNALAME